jgi:AraC family transcriptional activator FtrA
MNRKLRDVTAVAYQGLCTFEFGIVVEVFGLPRPELDTDWYRFTVCALEHGPLRATGGVTVTASFGIEKLSRAGTIIIPGWRNPAERPPEPLLNALVKAHRRGARLVSICSGVFVLAETGLLDGKTVTTHWRYVDQLRSRFPRVHVDADTLYIDSGSIMTSAGSAAGIDLCLHIVRTDYGANIANQVARRLVISPHRDGGQAQYLRQPIRSDASRGLGKLLEWILGNLEKDLTIDGLSRRAAMSPRNFARRFKAETGTTPYRWITYQRLLSAQRRLEESGDSMDEVAQSIGMQTAATFRHHFRQFFRTTPTNYRRRFRT